MTNENEIRIREIHSQINQLKEELRRILLEEMSKDLPERIEKAKAFYESLKGGRNEKKL